MLTRQEIFRQDMQRVCDADFIPWEALRNKTILITGATGLIGSTLIHSLLYANQTRGMGLRILALVRNEARARECFAQYQDEEALQYLVGNVEDLPPVMQPIDYMIHGASQTASHAFVHQPVETIKTALHGTENLLELARDKKTAGFVYLSSMEVYGHPRKGHKVTEEEIGALPTQEVRNSYPISKQQCESLCFAYAAQYGLPVMCVRLAQTFGPGIHYDDTRIFAQFARCVAEKRDIVLKTNGETERSYLYTADAAAAILTVLLRGQPGEAYNAAAEDTYCSIAQMARQIARMGEIDVRVDLQDATEYGYAATHYMNMDTTKLRRLGWNLGGTAQLTLTQMYRRMIVSMIPPQT